MWTQPNSLMFFCYIKPEKSLVERTISYIDMSLIFDTREFNVKHLYTGFYPAKQCSYFNPKQWETDGEASYSHKSFLMRSLSPAGMTEGVIIQSAIRGWWRWRFSRCRTSTACNIKEIWLCLLNWVMNLYGELVLTGNWKPHVSPSFLLS